MPVYNAAVKRSLYLLFIVRYYNIDTEYMYVQYMKRTE